MITLKNILVATDFSECSERAVEEARALAKGFDARLHMLHVVTEPFHEVWAGYAPAVDFVGILKKYHADARRRLESVCPHKEVTSGRVVIATAAGDPVDEILRYAQAHDVNLIVCGTHGRHGLEHVLIGSVAERVVRLAPCPVLTVSATPPRATAAA